MPRGLEHDYTVLDARPGQLSPEAFGAGFAEEREALRREGDRNRRGLFRRDRKPAPADLHALADQVLPAPDLHPGDQLDRSTAARRARAVEPQQGAAVADGRWRAALALG